MLLSRGGLLLKNIAYRKTIRNVAPSRPMSGGAWYYRDVPAPCRADVITAEVAGGIMWWWIMWNMWHDYGHIVGEYTVPDPLEWTDEELGILPED